jgi:hypothetical protein
MLNWYVSLIAREVKIIEVFHTDKYSRGAMVNFPNITNKK